MQEKLRIRQAVLVEGKYDKIKLETVLDALIIPLDGFRVYRDREMRALIRALARSHGIAVLTDSDRAGFRIRGYISGLAGKENVTHIYIPDLYGKERRKRTPSKEGKLGVEGMEAGLLREAFLRAGLAGDNPSGNAGITAADLYADHLSGAPHSTALRRALLKRLGLPERLSQKALLPVLNRMLSRPQYDALVRSLREEEDRVP